MQLPDRLADRLNKLAIDKSIYEMRSKKCILSKQLLGFEKVPWYNEHCYYLPENSEERKNNFIFDPVSLVPCLALDPKPQEKILDMCAAPGTKTYIMNFIADGQAHIIANDINKFRVRRLVSNISKFHISAEVANESGRKIKGWTDAKGVYKLYKKILLDAPCSGEGMINKKEKMFSHWSEARVRLMSKKQKKLIKNAFKILEEKGTLVYSTCTFAPEENEEVIDFLLKKHDNAFVEKIEIPNLVSADGIAKWGSKEYDASVEKCMRIYPHHNNTGGFFVCKIIKL